MTWFWVGAALLSLLAIGLVVVPWLRARRAENQDSLNNTAIIRQRLSELEQEVAEGVLSSSDKAQAIDELKLALVDETTSQSVPREHRGKAGLALTLGLVVSLVTALSVYFYANEIDSLTRWQAAIEEMPELGRRIVIEGDQSVSPEDLQKFALGIRTRLVEEPDDATAWLLLGRLYAALNRLESAIEAFERSLKLQPTHLGALSSYGQALVMTGDEGMMRRGMRALDQVIAQEPDNLNALSLLAASATRLMDRDRALHAWRQLEQQLEAGDPRKMQVQSRIAELSGEDTEEAGTRVTVEVALNDKLLGKMPQNGYLFVFAQDANSENRMPAAVVKTPISAFPTTVTLSDANAMVANFTLSTLDRTRLVARISADENVATAKGELEGEAVIELQKGQAVQHQILINKELL